MVFVYVDCLVFVLLLFGLFGLACLGVCLWGCFDLDVLCGCWGCWFWFACLIECCWFVVIGLGFCVVASFITCLVLV